MKTMIFLTASGLTVLGCFAQAQTKPNLSSYFTQKISAMDLAVSTLPAAAPATDDQIPEMSLEDINVDLMPTFTFGLSSVASISIAPEVDFILTPVVGN